MPVYTYHCENCDYEFDKHQSFEENALKQCPQCKKMSLYKVYKPARVVFKGSGYYVTDNRSSKSALSSSNGKAEAASGNGKSEKSEKAEKTESKTEAKKESK